MNGKSHQSKMTRRVQNIEPRGTVPVYQKVLPRGHINDRRHGGGFGDDSNNDYGLAPPNRGTVKVVIKRGHRKSAPNSKLLDTHGKPDVQNKDKDIPKPKGNTKHPPAPIVRDEEMFFGDTGKLDNGVAQKLDNDTPVTEPPRSMKPESNQGITIDSKKPVPTTKLLDTSGKLNAKPRNNGIPNTKGISSKPPVSNEERGLGISFGQDSYIDTFEEGIWSADDSSDSDEGLTEVRPLPKPAVKYPPTLRKLTQKTPSLLSVDDFSKKVKTPTVILYKRKQNEVCAMNDPQQQTTSLYPQDYSGHFRSKCVGFHPKDKLELPVNKHEWDLKQLGQKAKTIHNPRTTSGQHNLAEHVELNDRNQYTPYNHFTQQSVRGQQPNNLPPISAPSRIASQQKRGLKRRNKIPPHLTHNGEIAPISLV